MRRKSEINGFVEQKYLLILVVLFMLLIGACSKSPVFDCFNSTGSNTTENRTIGNFNTIELYDNVNLLLRQTNSNSIVVEAGKNLIPKIITEIKDDTVLVIKNDNSCNWLRSYDIPVNVMLDFKSFSRLDYRSVGEVTNQDTIRVDSLVINVWEGAGAVKLLLRTGACQANLHGGTADIFLRGISEINYYYQLGAGKIDAREFVSEDLYMKNWGSNDMFVWAQSRLDVEIKGLGDVYYKGNPAISSNLIGEGDLIRLDN